MKRLFVLTACVGLLGVAPANSAEQVPDRVMVRGTEYDLTLSKGKLAPGRAIVQFVNAGEDPHDLKLERVGDDTEISIGVVPSGGIANLDTRLRRGSKYVLWCSLSDHRQRGMEATLKVGRHAE
jgi:hypothetical protein